MYTFFYALLTLLLVGCFIAIIAIPFAMGQSHRRYRTGLISKRTYVRDCFSNTGILLFASWLLLLRVSVLLPPREFGGSVFVDFLGIVASRVAIVCFFAGPVCVVIGFFLLVRENR